MSKKKNCSSHSALKLERAIKVFDPFGEDVKFMIEGKADYRSYMGSLFGICIAVITMSFAVSQFKVMIRHGATLHLTTTDTKIVQKDAPLKHEETGFDFAIGIG